VGALLARSKRPLHPGSSQSGEASPQSEGAARAIKGEDFVVFWPVAPGFCFFSQKIHSHSSLLPLDAVHAALSFRAGCAPFCAGVPVVHAGLCALACCLSVPHGFSKACAGKVL
jgi:hypothetical protein